jgi:hypothetical protein
MAYMNRRLVGDQGLATAILHYTRSGCIVSVPATEATRYDLVIDRNGQLLRVQVKTTTRRCSGRENNYVVSLRTSGGASRGGAAHQWVSPDECDLVFVLAESGTAWELPVELAAGRTELSLHAGRDALIVGTYPPIRAALNRPPHAERTIRALPRGEERGCSRLTAANVHEIKASTESSRVLAERYGVTHRTISDIRRGATWAHLDVAN